MTISDSNSYILINLETETGVGNADRVLSPVKL